MSVLPCDVMFDVDTLTKCLGQLSHDDQVVLYLHYFCDLSACEIAKSLHTTRGAILVRLHRARQRLRELMGEHKSFRKA